MGGAEGAGRHFIEGEVKLVAGSTASGEGVGDEFEVVEACVIGEVGDRAKVSLDSRDDGEVVGGPYKGTDFLIKVGGSFF
jgi:hypothetical protein